MLVRVADDRAEAEVAQLDDVRTREEDVLSLDVPVDQVVVVLKRKESNVRGETNNAEF